MTIGERIRKIRRMLDLTQTEFAERIGSVQNTITGYETGRKNPSNPVISLICKEFRVREEWLRNEEGEIFIANSDDELEALAKRYDLPYAVQVFVEKLVTSNKDVQNKIVDILMETAKAIADSDTPADARPSDYSSGDVDSDTADLEAAYQKNLLSASGTGSTASSTIGDTAERIEA